MYNDVLTYDILTYKSYSIVTLYPSSKYYRYYMYYFVYTRKANHPRDDVDSKGYSSSKAVTSKSNDEMTIQI